MSMLSRILHAVNKFAISIISFARIIPICRNGQSLYGTAHSLVNYVIFSISTVFSTD